MKANTTILAMAVYATGVCCCGAENHSLHGDAGVECCDLPLPPPPPPTPEEIEAKRRAGLATAQSIPWDDANVTNRIKRMLAIKGLGYYANTNSLAYLSTVWRNPEDPAQYHALLSAISLSLKGEGDEWKAIVLEVLTNQYGEARIRNDTIRGFEVHQFRDIAYAAISGILGRINYLYNTNQVTRAKVEAFVNERLPVAMDNEGLLMDRLKCQIDVVKEQTAHPVYRHSQQRRDNLTRARNASHLGNVMNTPEDRIRSRYDDRLEDAQPVE